MDRMVVRGVAVSAVTFVAASVVASASAAPTRQRRAATAVGYAATQQRADGSFRKALSPMGTTADAVLAFVAARRGQKQLARSMRYLDEHVADATTTGLIAKVVLAVVAGGGDPRAFGGRDLVADLEAARQTSGQIGADTQDPGDPEVFDHALAMLAFAASDVSVGGAAVRWLVDSQCRDGGWQYDDPAGASDDDHCSAGSEDFSSSDTNTTAYAVQALVAAGGAGQQDVAEAFSFFTTLRDPEKGGWGYAPSFTMTDSNSTALVIQAHVAAERDLPDGAMRALTRLQYRLCGENAGAFAFTWDEDDSGRLRKSEPNLAATLAAIPALKKKALPLAAAEVTKPPLQPSGC